MLLWTVVQIALATGVSIGSGFYITTTDKNVVRSNKKAELI